MRSINQAGRELVKRFEQLRLQAYPDPATGGDPWTIGYGHTRGVFPEMVITTEQAMGYLEEDLARVERVLEPVVTQDATSNQFSAVVSLAFNCGAGEISRSTLVRKLNDGDVEGAADEFLRWDHADGKVMRGLLRRRQAERELFLAPD